MLRKGQLTGHTIWVIIELIFLAIFILVAIFFGNMIYDATIRAGTKDVEQLAMRINNLVAQEAHSDGGFATNLFVLGGDEDRALVIFDKNTHSIRVTADGPRQPIDLTIIKGSCCEEACICEVKIPDHSDTIDACSGFSQKCFDLELEGADTKRALLRGINCHYNERYDTYACDEPFLASQRSQWSNNQEEYPGMVGDEIYYPVFIMYLEGNDGPGGNRNLLLYLEYTTGVYSPKLLVTPYNQMLNGRYRYLAACPSSSVSACRNKLRDAPLGSGRYAFYDERRQRYYIQGDYCQYTGGKCVVAPAPLCREGPIGVTCSCDGVARNTGMCVFDSYGNQHYYDLGTMNCNNIKKDGHCENYCSAGCTYDEEHACVINFCNLDNDDYCHVQNGACTSSSYNPAELLADVAKILIDQGPGYRYALVSVPTGTSLKLSHGITSWLHTPYILGLPSQRFVLLCSENIEQTCVTNIKNMVSQLDGNPTHCKAISGIYDETCGFADNRYTGDLCNQRGNACICYTSHFKIENREDMSDPYECYDIGPNVLVFGDSYKMLLYKTKDEDIVRTYGENLPGAVINMLTESSFSPFETHVILVEAKVPDNPSEKPAVRLSTYVPSGNGNSHTASYQRGMCNPLECPPMETS